MPFCTGYKLAARTEHCYKYHAQAHALPWTVAARVCRAEGGYLADINSQHEADLLVDMFATKTNSIWSTMALVGFRMWGDKSWWTIHGEYLTYTYTALPVYSLNPVHYTLVRYSSEHN